MSGRIESGRSASSRSTRPSAARIEQFDHDAAAAQFESLLHKDRRDKHEKHQKEESDRRPASPDSGHAPKKERAQKVIAEDDSGPAPTVGVPLADQILKGIVADAVAPGTDVSAKTVPADLNAVVQQVADELQIGDVNGGHEVRIVLKDSVLPDTEVRLVQESGRLRVRFVTTSPESLDRIAPHTSLLQTSLRERIPGRDFVVSVQMNRGTGDHQSDRQSRGRHEYQTEDESESDIG